MHKKTMVKKKPLPKRTVDQWERNWRRYARKSDNLGYELPVDEAEREREFLTQTRTPEKELARLKRIQDEFVRGFKALYRLGPAVTVFGSARFKDNHRYYKLARAVGAELARAGFATLTGGGPGIHGSRESRGARGRRQKLRTEYHPAARAMRESLRG